MKQLSDKDLHKFFEEALDDIHGEVTIAGFAYTTSYALKNIDETAYDELFNNWLDMLIDDGSVIEQDGEYYDPDKE